METNNMKFYTDAEVKEELFGKLGSPERDAFESELENFLIGEAIKQMRLKQNLTQEQLGERIGVKRAQISKLESGKNVAFSTMRRVFKAMGATSATLELANLGRVALW